MKIKLDDGEHASIIDSAAIGGTVPEVGDIIEWEAEPETEDDLASGRYYVTGTTWNLSPKSNMVTLHLEARP